jgi:FkbM family methyltransferase
MSRLYPPFEHEYEVRAYVRGLLGDSRGGVFIDVGANVGVWTIDMAPLFNRVYAVEPWYADQLRLNLEDYGVGNVEVVEVAAWDFNGSVLIGISRVDNLVCGGRVEVPRVGVPGKLVKSIRLDDVVGEPFRLLKVDVEGEAMHVLRGMDRLLRESGGVAVIEVHNHGESHGTYLYMVERGWRLDRTLAEYSSGDLYHAHKVYVK